MIGGSAEQHVHVRNRLGLEALSRRSDVHLPHLGHSVRQAAVRPHQEIAQLHRLGQKVLMRGRSTHRERCTVGESTDISIAGGIRRSTQSCACDQQKDVCWNIGCSRRSNELSGANLMPTSSQRFHAGRSTLSPPMCQRRRWSEVGVVLRNVRAVEELALT